MAKSTDTDGSDIKSVDPSDVPGEDASGNTEALTPDNIDGSQQTENADDNARPAPDAFDVAESAPFVRADDFLTRGYLTEGEAWDAIGPDDADFDVVAEGTAFRIVKDESN